MYYSFIIIGEQDVEGISLKKVTEFFPEYFCAGIYPNNIKVLEVIAKLKPQLILFNLPGNSYEDGLSITSLTSCFTYLKCIPYVIIVCANTDFVLEAIQNGCSDYLNDLELHTLGKSLAKFERKAPYVQEKSICIKYYSDYHFLKYNEIVYLKADNNTSDFKMFNGSKITAYKTLKYFESVLPPFFIRIHKSYIVNIHFISRIQFSKPRCYLNLGEELPFSNNYRERIEQILTLNLIGH